MCKSVKYIIFAALAALYCINASAQQRYSPQRPTISPWLSLTDRSVNRGALPSYYRLVRPQLNQRSFDRSQALAIQKLSRVDEVRTTGATGSASVFNNRSHFFPALRVGTRRR